jgi:UDP-glucose:(heptosyl)LPS alpha-1,3-glucosyltransferase
MKIGLVRRGYSATGGAETYLLRLAAALVRAGHECVLFSDQAWPEAALHPVRAAASERIFTQATLAARGAARFARAFPRLAAGHCCDRILSLERLAACDVYRAGDGVHAAWLERRAALEPPWRAWLRRLQPKHRTLLRLEQALFTGGAARIIANSQMVKREILARFGGAPERISVIPNGLIPPLVEPAARAEVRGTLGLAEGDFVALFVGSDFPRKGLRFAIAALRHFPGAQLLVAGRGHAPAAPGVRLLGPRQDVPRLFAAADVFILPTIYDPFSNATLEALAAGLPVITTAANGCAEILTPGLHGEVIARPEDVPALAAALRAWASPEKRAATRAARLARGAEFSLERNVRETLAVLTAPVHES